MSKKKVLEHNNLDQSVKREILNNNKNINANIVNDCTNGQILCSNISKNSILRI